jgi:hypothetical protein
MDPLLVDIKRFAQCEYHNQVRRRKGRKPQPEFGKSPAKAQRRQGKK